MDQLDAVSLKRYAGVTTVFQRHPFLSGNIRLTALP